MFKLTKKIVIIIQVILTIIALISIYKIYDYTISKKEIEEIQVITNEIKENNLVKIEGNTTHKNKGNNDKQETDKGIETFLNELQAKYKDTVAYINIEGTEISYPVVQTEDNEYYLEHSPDGKLNKNGSIFMSYLNKNHSLDDNIILYGHNMKTGKMFQNLHKFKDQGFVNKHNEIDLYTLGGYRKYKIISVYIIEPELQYNTINYEGGMKEEFIKEIVDRSIIETDYKQINNGDEKLLTLSTCANGGRDRLIVHCIEITNKE